MAKTIIFAGALLALTGATMSSASAAAATYVNPAFRGAVAYRAPLGRLPAARVPMARMPMARMPMARGFRAPVRTVWQPAYRPALAKAPLARAPVANLGYGYRRLAQPAYRRFGYGYRFARQTVRPAYGRFATRAYPRIVRYAPARPTVTMSSPALALGVPAVQPAPAAVTPAPAAATAAPAVRRVAVTPVPMRPRITTAALPAPAGGGQVGGASYYSGGRTASGGFVGAATCAHRSLPFGTRLLVTSLANSRTTVCTVNDRGPFVGGRVVDLSRGAAGAIGMLGAGVAPVRLQVMGRS